MKPVRRRRQRKQRGGQCGPRIVARQRRRRRQKGGILPLAMAIPALMPVGKAVGLGAAGAAAGFGTKKALEAMTRKRRK